MAQIDSLEVRIEANASKAAAQVAELSSKLRQTSKAISEVAQQSSKLGNLTKATSAGKTGYVSSVALSYARGIQKLREYTNEYEALKRKQKSLEGKIAVADALGNEKGANEARSQYTKISAAIDDVIRKRAQFENMNTFKAVRPGDSVETDNQASAFERLKSSLGRVSEAASRARAFLSNIVGVLRNVGSAIGSAVSHTWKLVSALNGAHKSSEKSGSGFKKLAKFLIRYGFGMRSFFFLFRRLRRGMKEGFEHLGTYSADAQQAIYGLKASVETLKNAFAAGFSNLLGPVTNFLQGVINAIASALNAIGRFIAALGGKGFAIQAIKVSADEMKALDNNTGGAASSAKKLNKELSVLPFDELNQLNGDKNSGGSGGGGGGASANSLSASQMFETVALDGEEYIQQLGQRIREAFLSKDWQTLGEVLADPINKAVDALQKKLDWKTNKPKIEAFTKGVAETFNSLVKNVNWEKIGRTISDAINDITTAVTSFVDGVDWGSLGDGLGTKFNAILENTDWVKLGETLFARIKIVVETAAGFIERADWSKVGEAIGNFIIGALNNINLPRLGEVLGELINGAFTALNSAIQTGALTRFVSDFTKGIANLFASIDFELVGKTIGDAFAAIDWGEALGNLASAIWDALTGLLKGLASSDGGLLLMLLGGGYLGVKGLKMLTGGSLFGAAGGSGVAMSLAHVLVNAISSHPVIAAVAATLGFAIMTFYNPNGAKEFAERTDFEGYGLSEAELKALEQQGYSRATIAAQLKKGYGVDNYKKIAAEQIAINKKYAKLSVNSFATQFNKSLKTFTNQRDMQKQMNIMMDETVGITGIGGQNAVNEYIAGMDKGKETNKSRLTSLMNNILSAFNISGKIKTDGANATASWYTGANQKYNNEVSSELSTLTDKFAKKYNKDSTIKGYGSSGAKSWFTGANGYNPATDALASLAKKVKDALTGGNMKKSAEDAGKEVGNWFVNAFKVLDIPKLNMSVNKSALGTDAARAEKFGKVQSSAVWFSWNKKGGLYDAATIIGYGVGEAGKEAIIPLENRRTMGMIADSILGGYGTQGIADQIVRGVTEAMMMASRSQQINVNATLYTEDNEVLARAVNKGNRAITYRESALAYSGV